MKILGLALLMFSSIAWGLETGKSVPEMQLKTMDGKKTSSNAHIGKRKLTYVDFWASWCGPCKQSFPFMNALQKKYGDKGLDIVAISMDESKGDIDTFLVKNEAVFKILWGDPDKIGEIANPAGMPYSALVDSSGKVIAVHKGYNKKIEKKVEAEIVAALK